MMWMNTRSPALSDPRVRRAIDLAVSREDLVTAAQAGVPATGALADSYPFAAEGSLSRDPDAAAALLDEAGWAPGEDGVRTRDGEQLELVLYACPQRPDLVTSQPVIRAALAGIGIAVTTQVTESPSDVAASGGFDLVASLGFIGLSADTGQPEWGTMIHEYRMFLFTEPRLVLAPVQACTFVTVLLHGMLDRGSGLWNPHRPQGRRHFVPATLTQVSRGRRPRYALPASLHTVA